VGQGLANKKICGALIGLLIKPCRFPNSVANRRTAKFVFAMPLAGVLLDADFSVYNQGTVKADGTQAIPRWRMGAILKLAPLP
jgi:hypothetical protein